MTKPIVQRLVLSCLLIMMPLSISAEPSGQQPINAADSDADTASWALLGNSFAMQHHSDLRQINTETVSKLGLAWAIDLPPKDGYVSRSQTFLCTCVPGYQSYSSLLCYAVCSATAHRTR